MAIQNLEKFLPENTLPYLKRWFGEHTIHIKITKGRNIKLGDYRKMPDGSHKITINHNLAPPLFFFVLTHELAHLLAFVSFGHRIAPHGTEWKNTFRSMLLESIKAYPYDLQAIVKDFSRSPKANFMSSPELVRYFRIEDFHDELSYIEDLVPGDRFIYRNEVYRLEEKMKKNYLCTHTGNAKKYAFRPLARIEKIH